MCKKCENLIRCTKDHKATTVLVEEPAYDTSVNKMIMQINHNEETKESYAFISDHIEIESSGRCYGNAIDIRYCPFCGEKLY